MTWLRSIQKIEMLLEQNIGSILLWCVVRRWRQPNMSLLQSRKNICKEYWICLFSGAEIRLLTVFFLSLIVSFIIKYWFQVLFGMTWKLHLMLSGSISNLDCSSDDVSWLFYSCLTQQLGQEWLLQWTGCSKHDRH